MDSMITARLLNVSLSIGSTLEFDKNIHAFAEALIDEFPVDYVQLWDAPETSGNKEKLLYPTRTRPDELLRYPFSGRPDFGEAGALLETSEESRAGRNSSVRGFPVGERWVAVVRFVDTDLANLLAASEQFEALLTQLGASLTACKLYEETRFHVEAGQATYEHLAAGAARLALLIEHLQSGILVEDERRRIALTNKAFCGLFGIPAPPEALQGSNCAEAIKESANLFRDPDAFIRRVNQLLENREVSVGEQLELADGRTMERDYIPIFLEGVYRGHLWHYRDVTEHKTARLEVEALKNFYEQVLDAMPAQLAVFDREMRYEYVSASAVKDAELRQWLKGKTDVDYCRHRGLDPEIGRIRMENLQNVLEGGELTRFEEVIRGRDENARHIIRFVGPVFDDRGEVERILGYGLDVTELRVAEEARRETEERYKQLVENAGDIIYRADLDGKFTYANSIAERVTGFREQEIVGTSFLNLVPDEWKQHLHGFYLRQINDKVPNTYNEFPIQTKSGRQIWIGQNVQLVYEGGEVSGVQAVARDITDRKFSADALAQSEAMNRAIMESALDCLISIDSEGKVLDFNPAAERTFGFGRDEIVGKPMVDYIIPEKYREAHRNGLARYLETGQGKVIGTRVEITALRSDGTEFPVELAIKPIQLGDRLIFTAFLRDITDLKDSMAELVEAKQVAERSMKAREMFLANMSHEIRTPMNAILGMAHLLRNTGPTAEQSQYLAAIHRSAESLLALINDVLDIAKIESGRIQFEHIAFRLHETIDNVCEMVRLDADDKGVGLSVHVGDDVPSVLRGDPVRLTQVLLNLVTNALKFTPTGGVSVNVQCVSRDDGEALLEFEVADTGIGIASDQLERIFESFTQARSDTTRQYGGTGLGLAIVRELVERQGGRVSVASEEGEGSKFTVRIPYEIAADTNLPTIDEHEDHAEHVLRGFRILVAEDNELNQLVTRSMLQEWGASVEIAENGRIAVEMVQSNSYDLVLMDIQMPEMDGCTSARYIRETLQVPATELPILALTASTLLERRDEVRAAGMNDFILKPFVPADLRARILDHLRIARPESAGAEATQSLEDAAVDMSFLRANTLGQEQLIPQMIDLFLQQTPSNIERMTRSFAEDRPAEVRATAHKLKSSAGMLGAARLKSVLEKIEDAVRDSELHNRENLIEEVRSVSSAVMKELSEIRAAIRNGDVSSTAKPKPSSERS